MNMSRLASLMLALSLTGLAHAFNIEEGPYKLNPDDIKAYYQNLGINYLNFNTPVDREYKVNSRNEFQVRGWFDFDWAQLQSEITFNPIAFNSFFKSQSVLESKINYYKNLKFSRRDLRHIQDIRWPKEWGGLSHPPIQNKIQNLSLFSKRYGLAAPVNESLFDPGFQMGIDNVTNTELSFGNKLTILEDIKSYNRKLELIAGAKKSIYMSTVFFICDSSTNKVRDLLIKKHQAGVSVKLITDKFADRIADDYCLEQLEDAGIQHIRADDFWKYEGRTIYHSKKLIIDNTIVIVGGQNMIAADNLSQSTDFMNHDIDLEAQGPIVTDIALGFVNDWMHFVNKKVSSTLLKRKIQKLKLLSMESERSMLEARKKVEDRGRRLYYQKLQDTNERLNGTCRFVQQSPYEDRTKIGKAYLKLLGRTKDYLGIMDPAKMDTEVTEDASVPLKEKWDTFTMFNHLHRKIMDIAENRGIKIDFVTSSYDMSGNEVVATSNADIKSALKVNDFLRAQAGLDNIEKWNKDLGTPAFKNLLRDFVPVKNIQVWNNIAYEHSKVFYFDRQFASIGSYNFQHNATDHSYENTIICADKSLNQQLDELFVRDMANSIPLVFRE